MPATLRLDGSPCECGRPTGQCIKGDLTNCPSWEEEEADDDLAEYDINCGLAARGGCTLAGTEWCDWSCPHSAEAPHNRRRKPRPMPLFD